MDDCEVKFKRRSKKISVHHQDEQQQFDWTTDLLICEPKFKRLRRCNDKSGVHHQSSNWSDLPIGPLFEIMDRLIFADDYVRFGAVCVSWRKAYKLSSKTPSLPLLLIPPHDYKEEEEEDDNTLTPRQRRKARRIKEAKIPQVRSLYNVFTKKVCSNFQVPLSHNKYCRGSSFGWLVTTQRKLIKRGIYNYIWYVQLLNPFVSNKHHIIDIPPINRNKKLVKYDESKPHFYIHKAVLSSDPLFTPRNFVLMAIMTQTRKLGFYTPNNKDWTPVSWYLEETQDLYDFADVIFFNKTQQFYAVLSKTGQVVAVDLIKTQKGHIVPKLTQLAPPPDHADKSYRYRYLVETSAGELLQVARKVRSDQLFVRWVTFEVFKFDTVEQVWTQIRDIGDDVLFIGFNSSICRPSSHFPGCKSNCIYYTDDSSIFMGRDPPYGPHDAGIYNMENGTVVQHYPMASRVIFPTPIWLEPTLQRCNHS